MTKDALTMKDLIGVVGILIITGLLVYMFATFIKTSSGKT